MRGRRRRSCAWRRRRAPSTRSRRTGGRKGGVEERARGGGRFGWGGGGRAGGGGGRRGSGAFIPWYPWPRLPLTWSGLRVLRGFRLAEEGGERGKVGSPRPRSIAIPPSSSGALPLPPGQPSPPIAAPANTHTRALHPTPPTHTHTHSRLTALGRQRHRATALGRLKHLVQLRQEAVRGEGGRHDCVRAIWGCRLTAKERRD